MRKGAGAYVNHISPSKLGSSPGHLEMVNCCSREAKYKKSSRRASCSPKHALLPVSKCHELKLKFIKILNIDPKSMKRTKYKHITFWEVTVYPVVCLQNITSWKWHEGISLPKLAIFIQEVSWVKGVWGFPFIWIMQDWRQACCHRGALIKREWKLLHLCSIQDRNNDWLS